MFSPDHAFTRLVRRQHGAFNRRDARLAGFTNAMIRRRLANGRWLQLDRDVFAVAAFPNDWRQRCSAATLLHPAAALSHQSAGAHLGLDGLRPGRVHITVPPTAHHDTPLAVVHRSRHHDFSVDDGVRCSSFPQTMVQLAATLPEPALRAALHSGIGSAPRRLDQLEVRVAELRDRRMPGLRRLADLIDEVHGESPTASELERALFAAAGQVPGMPPIRRQVSMPWSPDRETIVDGAVEPWRLILEADGRSWHARVDDFDRDRWRDNEAAVHGYHVMRFTHRHLRHHLDAVVEQIRRYGERVAPSLAA